jgi:5-methylcytosine-specific restriction endonuclease McrA
MMARSRRYEFSKPTMREADKRAGGRCEATGWVYGLEPGQRCNAPFKGGKKEFDHYPLPATMEGSDTLENCMVCCPECHGHKTRTFDIPVQAKTKRVSDKFNGIVKPKGSLQGRPFGGFASNARDINADLMEDQPDV